MTFDEWYKIASKYKEQYGNLLVPVSYVAPTGEKLGHWIANCRATFKRGKLPLEKIEALDKIGMTWQIVERNDWQDMFALASLYKEEHGNLLVRLKYVTPDGKPLGGWIRQQRTNYQRKKLSKEQIEKLESIGMLWHVIQDDWDSMYNLATDYYKEHGNLNVPKNYVTPDGKPLGHWIKQQRAYYRSKKTITKDRIEKLEAIGMLWKVNKSYSWHHMYKLAEDYFKKHGNLKIHTTYVAENGEPLGVWITRTRGDYAIGKLSEEQIEKLEAIGMVWRIAERNWDKKYEMVRNHYLQYGSLSARQNSNPSLNYKLLNWLNFQRRYYEKGVLSESRIKKLEDIGINWNISGQYWHDMYKLASEYRLKYGNLLVPKEYITEDNKNLGMWIFIQRNSYIRGMLSYKKIRMLEDIGMVWNTKVNRTIIDKFIEELPFYIDKTINSDTLNHISLIELETKLQFLSDIGISPIDEDGKLIDIFSMSNNDVEEKYGVRIESLIKYYRNVNYRGLHI